MSQPGPEPASTSPRAGQFVISLDFELHWGVRDQRSIDQYRANLLGVREAVPRMLELFQDQRIHATWATVGFLMAEDREELLRSLPETRPSYEDHLLDPYGDFDQIGQDERDDPFHYAPSLVRLIAGTPGQELATHTLSHFYALEPGASPEAFETDLDAALTLARAHGHSPTSIVFPRNQVCRGALRLCQARGLTAFRGTERVWYQRARPGTAPPAARALRLLDAYLPLGSDHLQAPHEVEGMVNVPQSRFFRSCRGAPGPLDDMRLSRINRAMTNAARTGRVFHLWWHPHGFGAEPTENLSLLARVLTRYRELRESLGFESMTMREVADQYRTRLQ